MPRLRLRCEKDGALYGATASDRLLIKERFDVGDLVACDLEKYRSRPQNNTLFACIAYCFENRRAERWVSWEQLRAWLFCEVDYKDTITVKKPVTNDGLVQTIAGIVARVRKRDGYVFMREDPHGYYFDIAKSWQYKKLDHPDATAIFQAVLEVCSVEVVPGMSPDEIIAAVKGEIAQRKS